MPTALSARNDDKDLSMNEASELVKALVGGDKPFDVDWDQIEKWTENARHLRKLMQDT